MKFQTAWAETLAQNGALKGVVLILSALLTVVSLTAARLALKPPLVIDRGCLSEVQQVASSERTPAEVEAFVRLALSERFDTDRIPASGQLSPEEESYRAAEQRELSARSMNQRILIRNVQVQGNAVTVDADRLIAVGTVRSAFIFPLHISLATTRRSEGNPYGLVLENVKTGNTEAQK